MAPVNDDDALLSFILHYCCDFPMPIVIQPDTVAESVKHKPHVREIREGEGVGSRSSQTKDLSNVYLSLPSLAHSINMIGKGLDHSMSG